MKEIENMALEICKGREERLKKLKEHKKESEENVSEHSVLVNNGSNFYCVIQDKSGWVLGRYDKSLNLIQKSAVNISESTPITITGKGIVVTNSNNIEDQNEQGVYDDIIYDFGWDENLEDEGDVMIE